MAQRGPGTARGKAASSRNAIKPCPERPLKCRGSRRDGLRSDAPVIPELESFEDWERHRAGTIAGFAPEGYSETDFAERIASLSWRLKRVARYETETTAHYLDDIPDDMVDAALYGERALGIPRDVTLTPGKLDKLFSQRLLPSAQTLERIMRGACPERSRPQAAGVEGPASTSPARRLRRGAAWCSAGMCFAETVRLPTRNGLATKHQAAPLQPLRVEPPQLSCGEYGPHSCGFSTRSTNIPQPADAFPIPLCRSSGDLSAGGADSG